MRSVKISHAIFYSFEEFVFYDAENCTELQSKFACGNGYMSKSPKSKSPMPKSPKSKSPKLFLCQNART